MAFSSEVTKTGKIIGTGLVCFGTYAQGNGDTGGVISTGLSSVDYFDVPGVTSWSASGGDVTCVTADPGAAISGSWMAVGY